MKPRVLLPLALAFLVHASSQAQQRTEGLRVTAQGLMLDFQDADLRLVIAALADAGKLNVSYGDLPQKRVTLRTNQPVAAEQIPALLRSLAESNGLIVREEAGFVRIDVPVAASTAAPQQPQVQEEETRLFVYRLKHAHAVRLASTLQSIFGGPATPVQPQAQAPRQSLSESLREQRVPPLDSANRARVDVSVRPAQGSLPGQLHGPVQIVPEEVTNSLLVRAQPSDWEIVRQAVESLDLRPLQVLIEVVIAEVRRTNDLDLGVSAKARNSKGNRSGDLKSSTTDDFLLKVSSTGTVNVDVALAALSTTGDVRILSRPVVLAQNSQEARILIGSERPFVQVSRSLPTDAAIRDQVVQYRDVGTSLTIMPTINPDGYVNLQVSQEVSTATSETQFGAPVISTREASTHLFARDGQTVVIGGLVDRQQDYSRSGIPVLKEIPVLGFLFGSTRVREGNSELFLFLTPRILATDEDADRVREQMQNQGLLRRLGPVVPLLRRDSTRNQ